MEPIFTSIIGDKTQNGGYDRNCRGCDGETLNCLGDPGAAVGKSRRGGVEIRGFGDGENDLSKIYQRFLKDLYQKMTFLLLKHNFTQI